MSCWAAVTKAPSARTFAQPSGLQKRGGHTLDELHPIRAFRAAQHLRDADDVATHLQGALAEAKGDPALISKALGLRLQLQAA